MTDVYIALLSETETEGAILNHERQAQIDATRHPDVKKQRIAVWNTLLFGLSHSLGFTEADIGLRHEPGGKWVSDACGISLSHCKTAVAAAIASDAVGVDIEPAEDGRYREALLDRIATDRERERFRFLPTPQRVAAIWTRKEASFKRRGADAFSPIAENALSASVKTLLVTLDAPYMLSVATEEELRLFWVRNGEAIPCTDLTVIAPQTPYAVYMLLCRGGRLYTGITTDLDRRVREHGGMKTGAKFTHAFPPERIAAAWETDTKGNALKLEARIKKLTRANKLLLIEQNAFDLFGGAIEPKAYRRIEV